MRLAMALALAGCGLLVGACGGGTTTTTATSTSSTQSASRSDGLVNVRRITYTSSFDGSRVTGLLAVPRAVASRGCVIWQFGYGTTKEDSSLAWNVLASLGLSTFSIDFRYHGARGNAAELEQVRLNPNTAAEVIRGTVGDLHSAINYLEKQPYCRRNIAYGGVSLGGAIGTILVATDDRVKAAVLMVTPATWDAVMTAPASIFLPGTTRNPARLAAALKILSPLDPARFIGRISPRPLLIVSGLEDNTVVFSNSRLLQASARQPKNIVDYRGGHDPFSGPDASSNVQAVGSFLLQHIVEPTYGISGNANATFTQQ